MVVNMSKPTYTIPKKFTDCQNISLHYDSIAKKIYVIAFTTVYSSSIASYSDFMEIYELLADEKRLNSIVKINLKTKHGSTLGVDGVHFRWGTSQYITYTNDVAVPHIVACSRNFIAEKLTVNNFNCPSPD